MPSSRGGGRHRHPSPGEEPADEYYEYLPEEESFDTGQGNYYYSDAAIASPSFSTDFGGPYTDVGGPSTVADTAAAPDLWPTTPFASTEPSFYGNPGPSH